MNHFIISGYGKTPIQTLQYGSAKLALENPSFCCAHERMLFVLRELEEGAAIQLYEMQGEKLVLRDEKEVAGSGLCHLSYSPKQQLLFGACYGTGHIFSVGVADGHFTEIKSCIHLEAAEDNISRAHCIQIDQHQKYVYAINIHTDKVYCYTLSEGRLVENQRFSVLELPRGNGPRHMMFHPTLPIGYIITEYSSQIFVLSQDMETGELKVIQEISTLPDDYIGESYGATCTITSQQDYLLAANRGHDSIARFKLLEDGKLELHGHSSCKGCWPRHIDCTLDGKGVIVCNQRSDEVVVLEWNEAEGGLGEVIERIPFKEPSFVKQYV